MLLLCQLSAPKVSGQGNRLPVFVDAATCSRRGSPGTEWRLYLSFAPFIQQPARVKLTDAHGGEHLHLVLILLVRQRLARLDLPCQQWWAGDVLPALISTLIISLYRHLCEIVRPTAALERLLDGLKRFLRHLSSSRRKRPLQWAEAAARWFRRLAQQAALNVA